MKKGMVTAVDIERSTCRVLTEDMQFLNNVEWRSLVGGSSGYGYSATPQECDQVYLEKEPDGWIITGYINVTHAGGLPRPGVSSASSSRPDLMNLSLNKPSALRKNASHPQDTRVGDQILTTEGGARLGVLRAGTVVAKASPLAQFILSPYSDTARLVSRNYEHFTDLDSTYKVSSRGQLYSLHEVFRTTGDSRSQRASFSEIFGNVGVGEALGRDAASKAKADHSTSVSGAGADQGIVRKSKTFDASNELTSFEEEYVSGRLHRFAQKGGKKTEVDQTIDTVSFKVHGGDTSYYKMNESSIHMDVGTSVKIDMDKNGVYINANGNAILRINASGAVSLDCKNISVNSQAVNWNASSVTWSVSGAFTVSAGSINLN